MRNLMDHQLGRIHRILASGSLRVTPWGVQDFVLGRACGDCGHDQEDHADYHCREFCNCQDFIPPSGDAGKEGTKV